LPNSPGTKFKPIKRLRLLNKFAETGKQKTLPIELGGDLLRYATITAFLGAGLQALFWDFPLRALLWDQSWWNWCVELLGFSWTEWVTSLSVDQTIDGVGKALGGLLALLGVTLALIRPEKTGAWARVFLVGGACVLLLRSFLIWKEHFWQIGQLLEMFVLMGAPLVYLTYLKRTDGVGTKKGFLPHKWGAFTLQGTLLDVLSSKPFFLSPGERAGEGRSQEYPLGWLRLLIALTFTGHGLYAVGFHPVPANFVFMTQAGLGVGEDVARQLLFGVGVLDFLAAGLLLLPWRRAWLTGLAWIIPWAVLTTFARVWSYSGYVEWDTLIYQWIPEVVVRLPHILLPLVLFFLARTQDAERGTKQGGQKP